MKRLTATQAFHVLQEVKRLVGKEEVFGENSYMESMLIGDGEYENLQEVITPFLGRKKKMKKPYFGETYLGRPYWYDVKVLKYRELFEDIYGESWYFDGGDLVRGDKTVVHYKEGMTLTKLINEVQASLPATLEIEK